MLAHGRWYCWRRNRPTVASSARTGCVATSTPCGGAGLPTARCASATASPTRMIRWPPTRASCIEQADHDASFTNLMVPLPAHLAPEDVIMEPGDVLFFNGQVIHGSLPNRSRTRFRRALIAHYIAGEARQVAHYYFPVLAMDGREVALEQGPGGGPCGVWVDRNGRPAVEMQPAATT